jgi:hypothetical protein
MKYEKPEVNILANAVDAVQSLANKHSSPQDNPTSLAGGPAYEADE